MFFLLSKTLGFLLTPLAWIIIGVILTLFTKDNPWRKRSRGQLTLFLLLLFTNPWLSNKAFHWWEREPTELAKERYEIAVILTGMTHAEIQIEDRVQFHDAAERFIEPVRLYHQGKIDQIIISGGSGTLHRPELTEAPLLKHLAEQLKVKPEDLILEESSRNTHQNAEMTAAILKEQFPGKEVLLITSAFHMRRAKACFEKEGISVIPYPVDFRSKAEKISYLAFIPHVGALMNWTTLFHEWFGFLAYFVMGYV